MDVNSEGPWLIATGNEHKAKEIRQVLAPFGIQIVTPDEIGAAMEVEEWGETFAENAVIKAVAFAERTGRIALADDSGLEVKHLGWGPGVYSARFSGPDATDEKNNALLLEKLAGVDADGRTAQYRCVIALACPRKDYEGTETVREDIIGVGATDTRRVGSCVVRTFQGSLKGRIELDARGEGGFGYDPYFALPDGRHVAELPDEQKNAISHRGNALRGLSEYLSLSRSRG